MTEQVIQKPKTELELQAQKLREDNCSVAIQAVLKEHNCSAEVMTVIKGNQIRSIIQITSI